jgi:uncharacterized protein YkwD
MAVAVGNADARGVRAAALARIATVAAALATAAALACAPALPATGSGRSSSLASLQSGVLLRLNQIRRAHGLVPLRLNNALSTAAGQHSAEMLADGYFAHNSADGSAFWTRIERYYPLAQYRQWSVGENLLWSSGGRLDAKRALDLWMASPEHRTNILAPSWREIGIAAVYEADAPGLFGGHSVTVVATDFGTRS